MNGIIITTNVSINPAIYSHLYIAKNNNIKAANIFPTKKRAYEVAEHWNACFKANGTYYFDEPLF
jgi:hypothetical protein